MGEIEQSYALRTVPGAGDKIGVTRHFDPVTGDLVKGEQTSQYGHPAKFVKIATQRTSSHVNLAYPDIGAITTLTASSTTTAINWSGSHPVADPTGLLVRLKTVTTTADSNQVRKIISHSGTLSTLNRALTAAVVTSDPYDLWVPTFRYNFLMLKVEFSAAAQSIVIAPVFLSDNHDLTQPSGGTEPGFRASIEYVDRDYTISSSGIQGSAVVQSVETTFYHGQILALPCQGSVGMKIYLKTAPVSGNVSIWAAAV